MTFRLTTTMEDPTLSSPYTFIPEALLHTPYYAHADGRGLGFYYLANNDGYSLLHTSGIFSPLVYSGQELCAMDLVLYNSCSADAQPALIYDF